MAGRPLQHLGCEIEWCAGEIRRCIVIKFSARPEIHEDNAPILGSHHVVRLDIAMQQARAVHGGHGTTELEANVHRVSRAERCLLLEDLLERVATNELHPEADLVANLLGTINRYDVRMAHASEQAAFMDD